MRNPWVLGTAAALLASVDEQAARAGREGAPVDKTLCVLFQFGESVARHDAVNPVAGREAQLATLDALREIGLAHVQLILDPITIETIEETVELVRRWRRG